MQDTKQSIGNHLKSQHHGHGVPSTGVVSLHFCCISGLAGHSQRWVRSFHGRGRQERKLKMGHPSPTEFNTIRKSTRQPCAYSLGVGLLWFSPHSFLSSLLSGLKLTVLKDLYHCYPGNIRMFRAISWFKIKLDHISRCTLLPSPWFPLQQNQIQIKRKLTARNAPSPQFIASTKNEGETSSSSHASKLLHHLCIFGIKATVNTRSWTAGIRGSNQGDAIHSGRGECKFL